MKKYTAMAVLLNILVLVGLFDSLNFNAWMCVVLLYICGLLAGSIFGEAINDKKNKGNNRYQPK